MPIRLPVVCSPSRTETSARCLRRHFFGNVLDREYLGSPDELAVAAPGRHILLTLSAVF